MTDLLPLFPLGTVLFPGMPIPLRVFEERYRRMLDDRTQENPAFGIVLLRSGRDTGDLQTEHLHRVGTATRILSRRRLPDGQSEIVVAGTRRFTILAVNWDLGYGLATVEWQADPPGDVVSLDAVMQSTVLAFNRFVRIVTSVTGRPYSGVRLSPDPILASYDLSSRLPLHT